MQTFLPYSDFNKSVSVLDNRRLQKQIVEAKQILDIVRGNNIQWKNPNAWRNHPAILMWKGYDAALCAYGQECVNLWNEKYKKKHKFTCNFISNEKYIIPLWLGKYEFHLSHQSNLLRKDYNYYSQFFNVPSDLPYYWPVTKKDLTNVVSMI